MGDARDALHPAAGADDRVGGAHRRRLALLGALYLVGGLGEPLDPAASDPNVVVYALLRITGLLGAVALIAAGVATVLAALRGS
jgi:hypothetical protein